MKSEIEQQRRNTTTSNAFMLSATVCGIALGFAIAMLLIAATEAKADEPEFVICTDVDGTVFQENGIVEVTDAGFIIVTKDNGDGVLIGGLDCHTSRYSISPDGTVEPVDEEAEETEETSTEH